MNLNIFEAFGFFSNNKKAGEDALDTEKNVLSFADPETTNGAAVVEGGKFNHYLDFGFESSNEAELVSRYRTISRIPDVAQAIDEVVNEIITEDQQGKVVELNLDDVELPDAAKKKYQDEFSKILKMLDFTGEGYNHVRRWYIDGRLFFHPIIDKERPADGIIELRYIPPTTMKLVKEVERVRDGEMMLNRVTKEYYVYDPGKKSIGTSIADKTRAYLGGPSSFAATAQPKRIQVEKRSIVTATSGIYDDDLSTLVSHLHAALKVANQLSTMVDSLVIYRIARAPERRIFYVDVGNMTKQKAEQYMKDLMSKFKNQVTYDALTGEIKDARRNLNMMEDFWIPRREKGNATEITTLPGGLTLGQIDDINYFKEELWRSLKIPKSRFAADQAPGLVGIGRSSEITRDEIRFQKFIDRLRNRFGNMIIDLLGVQLVAKKITTWEDFDVLKETVRLKWAQDSFFVEMKETEIIRERVTTLQMIDPFAGKWFDDDYIFKTVLRLSADEEAKAKAAKGAFDKQQQQADQLAGVGGGAPAFGGPQ